MPTDESAPPAPAEDSAVFSVSLHVPRDEPFSASPTDGLVELPPRLARLFGYAEETRAAMLDTDRNGALLSGLEELLAHIDRAEEAFREQPTLARVSFLVSRASGDFETAIYGAVAGYMGATADAMRDVIEVELLLLDFATDLARLTQWMEADAELRRKKFSASRIRRRLKAVGRSVPDEDYQAHSQILHVNPEPIPVGHKGIAKDEYGMLVGLADMFSHGRRLLLAADALLKTAGSPVDLNPADLSMFSTVEAGLRGFLLGMREGRRSQRQGHAQH